MIPSRQAVAGLLLALLVWGADTGDLRAQESEVVEESQEEEEVAEGEESREETGQAATVGALAERFRPFFEGRIYSLRMNLHKPEPGGHPAPWMDVKGWHRRDTARPVILALGEGVQVTGVFDYGDRSVFIELTRWPSPPWNEEAVRMRIRMKAESGPDKPEKQDEEIRKLLALVLEETPIPSP